MRRLFPKTLRGQLVLVILATFVLVQGINLWLFADERSLAVRATLGLEAAGRTANVVRLLETAPQELRADILRAADSPLVRFSLGAAPSVDHIDRGVDGSFARRIASLLEDNDTREIRVELHRIRAQDVMADLPPDMERMHKRMMGARLAPVRMRLSVALRDGSWLNVSTRFHHPPIQWPWASTISYGMATLTIMIIVWITLSRLVGPLARLADSAESLGRGEAVAELSEQGPQELRRLTRSFNDMQARLTRFVSERTRLLAALGHDLRSPLTAMRVRAEMVEDAETRERLAAIIAEMQEMVDSTLSFARGMVTSEETRTIDMNDFLRDLTAELKAVGGTLSLNAQPGLNVRIKPVAMRRALRNVIENAIRYGQRADIEAGVADNAVHIIVTDQGPGIPEADLERVFDPFVRVEKSRNMETGGTGLGLSIARTVIHAHGGEITLSNPARGGLRVVVDLPLFTGTTGTTGGTMA